MSLNADRRVYTAGIRNISDAISAVSIATSAVEQLGNIGKRLSELAEQSANGTYSHQQRKALNIEAQALAKEYNRIIDTTKFNDIKLLDGSSDATRIQLGYGLEESLRFNTAIALGTPAGNGTFTQSATVSPAGNPAYALADFNNDGTLDVLTQAGSILQLRNGNGDGTFGAIQSTTISGFNSGQLTSADMNNDGWTDVVDVSNGNILVLLNNKNGTFSEVSRVPNLIGGVLIGDLNSDEKSDLVEVSSFGTAYNAYLNSGTGAISASDSQSFGGTQEAYQSSILDYDGDGNLDVIKSSNAGASSIYVFRGNGDGTFKTPQILNRNGNGGFAVADVNGDGRKDIVSGEHGGGNTLHVFLQNSDGTLAAAKSTSGIPTLGGFFTGVSLGDIDGDGDLDAAYGNYDLSAGTQIYLNDGRGNFSAGVQVGNNQNHYGAVLKDLNGDGRADLIGGGTQLGVYLSRGDGTFDAGTLYATGGSAYSLTFADLNNDDLDDLILNGGASTIYFMIANQGSEHSFTHINPDQFDISTQAGARGALTNANKLGKRIALESGALGAIESRLSIAKDTLVARTNAYAEAESRIVDADVASETADLVRNQILTTVSSQILKANRLDAQLVLKLLSND
jgi:flagellin-like hook-associated protein FlgL